MRYIYWRDAKILDTILIACLYPDPKKLKAKLVGRQDDEVTSSSLLFTYSLVSKISFQHSKNNLTKELRYGLSEANLGLSIIP